MIKNCSNLTPSGAQQMEIFRGLNLSKSFNYKKLNTILATCLFVCLFSNSSFGQTTTIYTTAGAKSWICPRGAPSVKVEAWGGGAGGRTSPNSNGFVGGGGGGGSYARRNSISVTGGTTYNFTVTLGAGGAANTAGGNTSTTFNSVIINAPGGSVGAASSAATPAGGAGGLTVATFGGAGGGNNGNGTAATVDYGGGGAGAKNNPGGAGMNGAIIITFTCPIETAVAGPDQTLACGLTTATLAGNTPATPLLTGTWTVISGTATITSPNSPTSGITGLASSGTTTLRWTIDNGLCGVTTDDDVITTKIPPAITTNTVDLTILSGGSTSFSVVAINSPTSFAWELSTNGDTTWSPVVNGGVYSNATTTTLNITAAPATMDNYKYRVTVTNSCGSLVSSVATLLVGMSYCTSTGSTAANGINRVIFNTIYKWIPTTGGINGFGNWTSGNENMIVGLGYIERGLNTAPLNSPVNFTSTFTGVPNNGNLSVSIARGTYNLGPYATGVSPTQTSQDDDNWNLIGNPYPSAISADTFLTANTTNLDGYIKVWRHGFST